MNDHILRRYEVKREFEVFALVVSDDRSVLERINRAVACRDRLERN